MGCQPTMSKFGQNLTFARHLWHPHDVTGMSESHIFVRIWLVHLWSDPDIYKTVLMSPEHPGDVRPQSPSLVRIWHSQDIAGVHRTSKGCQNTSPASMNWFGIRIWLHSFIPANFWCPGDFLWTSSCDVRFWHSGKVRIWHSWDVRLWHLQDDLKMPV